ncbi:alpha/beta fold hydrolase [Mucilaginibacter terrenus]|uniref:Alpha/beta fold hydrolase n=1 Tax=Mucilaginibacter terrenus TaxID=2482727 RepID=A0A3E2NU84_9SPHI|nr:alpha/beta fold hydrolase [Mucilaginibacter terrenus]RFZ84517.1 alpha/beta fold hydrolase [Mucilaginibacter terrenus]
MPPKIVTISIDVALGKSTQMRYVHPEGAYRLPVLILPAFGISAKFYDRLLKSIALRGSAAAIIDFQGQGSSSVLADRKNDFGYNDLLTEDIPAAISFACILFNTKKIELWGHSMGGQLGSLYCATHDQRIARLVLCTTCSVYYRSWKGFGMLKVLLFSQFVRLIAKIYGYYPGERLGFGGRSGKKLINDWGQQALSGRYKIEGSNTNWEIALQSIMIPIHAVYLKKDFLAPPRAVEHLLEKFTPANVTSVCLDEPDLNHTSWVRQPQTFLNVIMGN